MAGTEIEPSSGACKIRKLYWLEHFFNYCFGFCAINRAGMNPQAMYKDMKPKKL